MTDGFDALARRTSCRSAAEPERSSSVDRGSGTRTAQMFDCVWNGRRHVMMGATQVDRYGNQNIAAHRRLDAAQRAAARLPRRARQHDQPHHELLGARTTRHEVFVEKVDVVCGVGYDRAAALGRRRPPVPRDAPRRDRTSACSTSSTPDDRMRLRSVHPGVTVDEVVEATGFEL